MCVWRPFNSSDSSRVEEFLRKRESNCVSCVNACMQFKALNTAGEIWLLIDGNISGEQALRGLVIYRHRTLFPVFDESKGTGSFRNLPLLQVLKAGNSLYGLQGSRTDALYLEEMLLKAGYKPWKSIDYDLMELEGPPSPMSLGAGPQALIVREAQTDEIDALLPLQAAYAREEVLPASPQALVPLAAVTPVRAAALRLDLVQLLEKGTMLLALLDGKIAAKLNSTAEGFHCVQLGGVYVLPGYRRLGIATRLVANMACRLNAQGRKATLFVKKTNPTARSVYEHAGFHCCGGYRISYFKPV
jgi:ribosomal protein S18 acetylase RimI-like enzyme